MADYGERSSLLQQETTPSAPPLLPPAYESVGTNSAGSSYSQTGIRSFDELPPPYIPTGYGGLPMINCKVCQTPISLDGKITQLVVKCSSCNEATPIRPPPPGKKYIRCQCNCLLICKSESRRVICPRETCRQMIVLGPPAIPEVHTPGYCRITCAHCSGIFQFNIVTQALAICPHCRKVSSVGPTFARTRAVVFLIAFLFILLAAILTTVFTRHTVHQNSGIIAAYVVMYLAVTLVFWRCMHYVCMKVSHIEGPV